MQDVAAGRQRRVLTRVDASAGPPSGRARLPFRRCRTASASSSCKEEVSLLGTQPPRGPGAAGRGARGSAVSQVWTEFGALAGCPGLEGNARPCTHGWQQGCQAGMVRGGGGGPCSSEQAALRASGCSVRLRASWLLWDLRSGNPRAEAPAPRRPVLGERSTASRASGNPQVFYQHSFALTIPRAP